MHTLSKFSLVAAIVAIGLSCSMVPQRAVADGSAGAASSDASRHQTRQQKRDAKHHARHEKRHARHAKHDRQHRVDHPVAAVKHRDGDTSASPKHDDRGDMRDGGGRTDTNRDRGRNGGDRMSTPAPAPTNDKSSQGAGSPSDMPAKSQ